MYNGAAAALALMRCAWTGDGRRLLTDVKVLFQRSKAHLLLLLMPLPACMHWLIGPC